MEPPSAPARRGRVPWQGLLLAVSLLTFWSPLTTAQLALEFMPSNAAEWEDVLFLAHNLPEDLAGYAWFKGGRVDSKRQIASYKIDTGVNNPGPAYSGRETIYPNGSLLFQKVTLEDTGYYTLQAIKTNFHNEEVTGQNLFYLRYGPEAPTISPSDTHYRSGANLNLSCHAASNPPAQYSWLINGRPKQSTQEVTIPNITPNDSGSYTCVVHNSVTRLNGTAVRTITVSAPCGRGSFTEGKKQTCSRASCFFCH
uniref:Ig-like domain-containing protein n=1 Tax=Rhinolophus ferrumequinum TaxID=59479 RepID=A0A671FT21_RHIFE